MSIRVPTGLATLCVLASLFSQANAQTPTAQYLPVAKKEHGKTMSPEHRESAVAEQQRTDAISIITALADESNTFKDQTLRVRVQARAADILWESDREHAKQLFLRAWETANNTDREGERATEEARKRLLTSKRGIAFIPPVPNLRSEVLGLAARRDQALGESMLALIDEAKDQEEATDSAEADHDRLSFFDPTDPPPAIAKRLELATDLLKQGDIERAKMFADRALDRATSQGMIFLGTLRQKDDRAADERYAHLLALAANDQSADATTVSLLSSYVFAPQFLVTATQRGRVSNQWSNVAPAADPPAELRAGFIKLAARILLRPLPPPDQDHTSAGRAGTYFTIARLLPFFEQYAPDQVPALNARLAVLAPDTPEVYKNNDNGLLTIGLVAEDPGRDDLSNILSQLSISADGSEHDLIYVKAIRVAAMKGDERIREFADKIQDNDLRKWARSFADFVVVYNALEKKDAEAGARIISAGNLPPIQRAWAYSEAASLLKKSDPSRAIQLLNEAAKEARGINDGEPDRVRALTCVALQFFALDRARTWEITTDVVKASNAVADFTGEDSKLTAQLRARNVIAVVNVDAPTLNLAGLFDLLAKDDSQHAFTMANGLKSDAARATADLAIAHSLLKGQGEN